MKKTGMLLMVAFSLVGCKEEKIHDVQYYLDHPEERKEQVTKCHHNAGEFGNTPNCQNALTAEARSSFRGTRPIELPVLKIK